MSSEEGEEQTQRRYHYEAILKSIAGLAFVVGSDWKLEYANDAALSDAGVPLEAIKDEPIMDLTEQLVANSEDPEKFERALERVYADDPETEYPVTVELELALPVGTVTSEFRCSPDSVGDEVKAVVVSRNITERKRELEQQRKRLLGLFEKAPEAVVIHDQTGDILNVNEKAVEYLGYSRAELLSMNAGAFATDYTVDEARQLWESMDVSETTKVESTHERKDGSTYATDVWVTKTEIQDQPQYISTFRDITARKKAQQKLTRRSEAIETATDGIGIFNADMEFIYANQAHAAIYGYDEPEAFYGNTWEMLYGDEEIEWIEENVLPELRETGQWRGETIGRKADGAPVPTELSLSALDSGELVAIVRDITDRKKREQKVRRQRDHLEFFNSILRHDLLNGIQVIQTRANLLSDRLEGEEQTDIEKIINWSENIVDLTTKTRDILDTLNGDETAELKPILVREILEEIIPEIKQMRDGVTVELECPEDVTVQANDLLEDLLRNLLTNAVEHTRPDPVTIEIRGRETDETLHLVIEDDGSGIPPDQQDSIFDRGESGEESTGTGFGLYFVNSMIDIYGGDIRVESADPGARFVMKLPLDGSVSSDHSSYGTW